MAKIDEKTTNLINDLYQVISSMPTEAEFEAGVAQIKAERLEREKRQARRAKLVRLMRIKSIEQDQELDRGTINFLIDNASDFSDQELGEAIGHQAVETFRRAVALV